MIFYGTSRPRGINKNAMALSRPVKRELTVYGTSRPRGVDKNAKTFRKQNQKQKRKLIFVFIFIFIFHFCSCFHFRFSFCSWFHFCLFVCLFLNFTMAPLGHHSKHKVTANIKTWNCLKQLLQFFEKNVALGFWLKPS